MSTQEKLRQLRHLMHQRQIDAWIIPSADPHQSEYTADHWQARAWLSGFSGSAGTLVVTQHMAGLWTDPRYHIRAQQELAGSGIDLFRMGAPGVPTYQEWLAHELPRGAVVSFDGLLFSVSQVEQLAATLRKKGVAITRTENLVDQLWTDRPSLPDQPITLLDEAYCGESRGAKLERIRDELNEQGAQALLLTRLDDIAWTFNLRGRDIDSNPVAICYAYIGAEEAHLFIDPVKVSTIIAADLARDGVFLADYESVFDFLARTTANTTVLLDPAQTNFEIKEIIAANGRVQPLPSIPRNLKAVKNDTEIEGFRQAHGRDGTAMVKWLYWLDRYGFAEKQTELTLGSKLTEFRQIGEHYAGLSFGNIVGFGANSAVGHYSPQPETTPVIRPSGILLIDSGAHYLDGTTDITRTITLGDPAAAERLAYSTVLQCLIRLSTTLFPSGTTGGQLDTLARQPLWHHGWNCRHGIGHGVGHYLNVHEGPQRLSPHNNVPLVPGMVLTNEPGVYFEGAFGVRLENIMIVQPARETAFGEFYQFETVTLCPFDPELIDPAYLNSIERSWLNQYHQIVYDRLAPYLNIEERAWLAQKTRPIME